MAAKISDDEASKRRIISHMNRDHPDSVMRYLEHYSKVPYRAASRATLTDVTLSELRIASRGHTHTIPISPPLASWSDARERFAAMDKACLAALSRHPVSVREYRAPNKPPHYFMVIVCVFLFVALPRRRNFLPGSWVYEGLVRHVPGLPWLALQMRWPGWAFMVAVHAWEAAVLMPRRLERHSVPMFGRAWWMWNLSTFVEGFTAFMRFSDVVADKERQQAKMKH